jgi:hypothetical protein
MSFTMVAIDGFNRQKHWHERPALARITFMAAAWRRASIRMKFTSPGSGRNLNSGVTMVLPVATGICLNMRFSRSHSRRHNLISR